MNETEAVHGTIRVEARSPNLSIDETDWDDIDRGDGWTLYWLFDLSPNPEEAKP